MKKCNKFSREFIKSPDPLGQPLIPRPNGGLATGVPVAWGRLVSVWMGGLHSVKSTPGKLKMEGLELLRMFAALHLTLPPFSQALSCFACALSEFCRGSVCQVSPLEAPDLALSAPGLRSTPLRSVPLRPSALRASSSAPEGLIHRLRLAKLGKGFGKTGKGLPKAAPGPNSACKIRKSSYPFGAALLALWRRAASPLAPRC